MLDVIVESVVFSIILIVLWTGFEALMPRLASLVKRRRRSKTNSNYSRSRRKRRKSSTAALGPSMPHFWRD